MSIFTVAFVICDTVKLPPSRSRQSTYSMNAHSRDGSTHPVDEYDAWWRLQMETFSALLALCSGNSPVTAEFPAQRPVTRSFYVFFDL